MKWRKPRIQKHVIEDIIHTGYTSIDFLGHRCGLRKILLKFVRLFQRNRTPVNSRQPISAECLSIRSRLSQGHTLKDCRVGCAIPAFSFGNALHNSEWIGLVMILIIRETTLGKSNLRLKVKSVPFFRLLFINSSLVIRLCGAWTAVRNSLICFIVITSQTKSIFRPCLRGVVCQGVF